jgi:hypothetical protein
MNWNPNDPQRFNPMDSGVDDCVDIATIQIINSLRKFLTGECGVRRMNDEEFMAILMVAVQAAARDI